MMDTSKWNQKKDIALKVWAEVKKKAGRKGYIGYRDGDRLYIYNFPILGISAYFPITRYYKEYDTYVDGFFFAEYEEITDDWNIYDLLNCDEDEDDFDVDNIFLSDLCNEEKKFIKIIARDIESGRIQGKKLKIKTVKNFIKMIVPPHWNIVTKEKELRVEPGTLNIELMLHGFDKDGNHFELGMPYPYADLDAGGCVSGTVFYKGGYSTTNLAVQATSYLDWRATVIHELAHIACLRRNVQKEREEPDGKWLERKNLDSFYTKTHWMVDENGDDHGEQFKKAMDRFRMRYEKAVMFACGKPLS